MERGKPPDLDWRGRVPVARTFDDPYFSLDNGLEETRHVFLDGNDLPARFEPGFSIAELGFGTGLNCFAALSLWRASEVGGALTFTSFERFPMAAADMERALEAFPAMQDVAAPVLKGLAEGQTRILTEDLRFELVVGDARKTLPDWSGTADAWFLDGFAPTKNPELWEEELLCDVARHTKPGGTCATYSAAGAVRAALDAAGFAVERRPGFGRKRHMTVGRRR